MRTPKRPPRGKSNQDSEPTKGQLPKKNIKPTKLRIIGGSMRGRGVLYVGDRAIRPMKESLREAMFNIVGPAIKGRFAWDLFAGTGILAIESFSRGAAGAVAVERNRRFAQAIEKNAAAIGIGPEEVQVLCGDTFKVSPTRMSEVAEDAPDTPWVVFFCPPYAMWMEETEALFDLLNTTARFAPPSSLLVVEADKFFDITTLPLGPWDVRPKGNMTLAFLENDQLDTDLADTDLADTDLADTDLADTGPGDQSSSAVESESESDSE